MQIYPRLHRGVGRPESGARDRRGLPQGGAARSPGRTKPTKVSAIDADDLLDYLGVPRYEYGLAEEQDEIGVATGAAVTSVGGDLLSIEVTIMEGKGELILTGQLGEVMQESGRAAISYARSRAARFRDRARLLRQAQHPHPHPGRRHSQGWPVGRHHDGYRADFGPDRRAKCARTWR